MLYSCLFFSGVKIENYIQKMFDIFNIFAQNIDCGYSLEPPHLCFEAKLRKIGIPLCTQVLPYKIGVQGVCISRTCYPDELCWDRTVHVLLHLSRVMRKQRRRRREKTKAGFSRRGSLMIKFKAAICDQCLVYQSVKQA